ncbi:HNH endonuclease [Dongia sp.]|uniref:HNH endonuclease n=1 Tax=Dongia sp. TaxID=1977262 RepID=UPI0035B1E4F2
MPRDPFYSSATWKRLRLAALKRDGGKCIVKGCGARATHVDHIVSRRNGGADALPNLRSLCASHDAQIKERSDGTRKRDGKPVVVGCDANGWPLDPDHAWNKP